MLPLEPSPKTKQTKKPQNKILICVELSMFSLCTELSKKVKLSSYSLEDNNERLINNFISVIDRQTLVLLSIVFIGHPRAEVQGRQNKYHQMTCLSEQTTLASLSTSSVILSATQSSSATWPHKFPQSEKEKKKNQRYITPNYLV